MCKTARELGYALALHGSMQRDCDLIAVPWVEDAVSVEELIDAFVKRHGFVILGDGGVVKPHVRVAYSLGMGGHFYFDVSVMPRDDSAKHEHWCESVTKECDVAVVE